MLWVFLVQQSLMYLMMKINEKHPNKTWDHKAFLKRKISEVCTKRESIQVNNEDKVIEVIPGKK